MCFLYGCVCSCGADVSSGPSVFCIISKQPLFEIIFSVLEELRRPNSYPKSLEQFFEHVNNIGSILVSQKTELVDVTWAGSSFKMRLPQPLTSSCELAHMFAVRPNPAEPARPSESGRTHIGDDRPNPAEKHVFDCKSCISLKNLEITSKTIEIK